MFIYTNYRSQDFIERFEKILDIDSLIESSVELKKPKVKNERTYKKCCRLDFAGISALLLHEPNESIEKIQKRFEEIFKNQSKFNENGVFITCRFLLIYPYSAHALARMQAEHSKQRCSINTPSPEIDDWHSFELDVMDKKLFDQSVFIKRQIDFLDFIGKIMHQYKVSDETLNRIVVRFVPGSVNVCMYCINHTIFSAPYLLAKQNVRDDRCVTLAPVVEVDDQNKQHKKIFDAFLDHFRYLWELPQTILSKDATYYEPVNPILLKKIKSPIEIKFQHKFPGTKDINNIRRMEAGYLLRQLCPRLPEEAPTHECIFIACSWHRENHHSLPNRLAKNLQDWLEEDFGPQIRVEIVDAPGGESLNTFLYKKLNASSVGIIIATADYKDSDGKHYARPNIYQELGYLMGRFAGEGIGNNRVIPVVQKGVVWPSNVKDLVVREFEDEYLFSIYGEIIEDLSRLLSIDQSKTCKALEEHKKRVSKLQRNRKNGLNKKEINELIRCLHEKQENYSCPKCSSQDSCSHKDLKQKSYP